MKLHLEISPKLRGSALVKVQMPTKSSEWGTVGKLHVPAVIVPRIVAAFSSQFDVTMSGRAA